MINFKRSNLGCSSYPLYVYDSVSAELESDILVDMKTSYWSFYNPATNTVKPVHKIRVCKFKGKWEVRASYIENTSKMPIACDESFGTKKEAVAWIEDHFTAEKKYHG